MKRIFSLILAFVLLISFAACAKEVAPAASGLPEGYAASDEETDLVCIEMENGGVILLELYPEIAPKTVANFKKLVGQGFYDGLTFHRVRRNFVIQGGDPQGNGSGGPGWSIEGEFTSNGFENDLQHTRGVLSMARAKDPNSAGSQFFIMHKTDHSLDGNYAAFGRVVVGMNVVDEIATCQGAGETPVEKQVMKRVFFVEYTGEAQPAETAQE